MTKFVIAHVKERNMRNLFTKSQKTHRIRWVLTCCALTLSLLLSAQPTTVHAADDIRSGIIGVWLDWTVFESGNAYDSVNSAEGYYGRFQFATEYCVEDFVHFCQTENSEHFSMLDLNNLAATWQQAYDAYPQEFALLQDRYAFEHYYLAVRDGLRDLYDINLRDYSEVIRGTAFSIAIRDGRYVSLNSSENNLRAFTDTYYPGISEEEWIAAIYDAEADRHPKQDRRWRDEQKAMALEALASL